jgi:glycerate kinase
LVGRSADGTFGDMRVLVCPDKFRGTLTARQAAEAIETGWRRSRPVDVLDLVPMADGGEGTLEALVDAQGGRIVAATVTGPLGDPVDAAFGLVETAEGLTAVVESARASGLALLGEGRRDPLRTTTRGTGELILAALEAGARRVVVCLGGSATNDGGVGMAAALGIRFLDAQGRELADGGAALLALKRIDEGDLHPAIATASFLGATDVENPLCGPSGASHVYGPQKGASPEDVFLLERGVSHLAAIVHHDLGIALKDEPGAGAAGGLGFGLLAFCGARLRRGVDVVMEAVDLGGRMEGTDLVITGEGSLDAQSLFGKVPAGVIRLAGLLSVPVAVLCGRSEVTPAGVTVRSLVDRVGEEAALGDARRSLELLASELATDLPAGVAR